MRLLYLITRAEPGEPRSTSWNSSEASGTGRSSTWGWGGPRRLPGGGSPRPGGEGPPP